jgi:hypothetical protein
VGVAIMLECGQLAYKMVRDNISSLMKVIFVKDYGNMENFWEIDKYEF